MPSRSIGDFRLKHSEFNFHNKNPELGYLQPIENYTGPYISHRPEIREYDLTKNDAYIVIASDGLWDHLPKDQVATSLSEHSESTKQVSVSLFNQCMNNLVKERGISREFLSQMRPSNAKRNYVDDITIVVMDLTDQVD